MPVHVSNNLNAMSEEIIDVEVVRLQSDDSEENPDHYIEEIKCLCKAFCFGLKIIDQCVEGENPVRVYDIYFNAAPFMMESYRNVIKTFILSSNLLFVNTRIIKMDFYEFMDMPNDGIHEKENLILLKPQPQN